MMSNSFGGTARRIAYLFALGLLLSGAASAQSEQDQSNPPLPQKPKETINDVIERVKQGDFALADLENIARAGAVHAIPVLEQQFAAAQDATVKGKIAFALVRLGDKSDIYWNYLAEQASLVVASDMPDPNNFDSQGKVIAGPSAAFTAWAKAHKLTTEAAETLYGDYLHDLMFLGETGDPRAIPYLRQALLSPNFEFETVASLALTEELQDKASIPLIIDACQRAPAEAARGMAIDLLRIDDPRARAGAEQYLPKDLVEKIVAENRRKNQNK